jgi:hypothetical protein
VRPVAAPPVAEDLEDTALEWVMFADDPDEPRDIIDVGSVG